MFRNAVRALLMMNTIIFLISPSTVLGATHVYDYQGCDIVFLVCDFIV